MLGINTTRNILRTVFNGFNPEPPVTEWDTEPLLPIEIDPDTFDIPFQPGDVLLDGSLHLWTFERLVYIQPDSSLPEGWYCYVSSYTANYPYQPATEYFCPEDLTAAGAIFVLAVDAAKAVQS